MTCVNALRMLRALRVRWGGGYVVRIRMDASSSREKCDMIWIGTVHFSRFGRRSGWGDDALSP